MRKLAALFAGMSVERLHGIYVWWLTIACLSGMMILALARTGSVAEHAVDSLSSVLTVVVCTYLGVEVVNRSQLLNKLGDRFSQSSSSTTIDPMQPPAPPAQ